MAIICRNISAIKQDNIMENIEKKYDFTLPISFKCFFAENNGGVPLKKEFMIDEEDYEVRTFLSFNEEDYNSIQRPLEMFQMKTKGKIVPFAKDSGDNYYCINVKDKKIYYWSREDELYYILVEDFEEFIKLLV